MENFTTLIKQRRLELNLTQKQVANKAQVAQNFIAYLEKGERKPSVEMIKKLSKILSLPSDKLYFTAHQELKGLVNYSVETRQIQKKLSPLLEDLAKDQTLRKQYHITDAEIDQLAVIRGRGEIKTKKDYVFLLVALRQVFQ